MVSRTIRIGAHSLADLKQLPLLPEGLNTPHTLNQPEDTWANLGTFKDSLRAPIHSWFQYPAGYSYKFVDILFQHYGVKPGAWVYDPFSGSGTTLICAKQHNINGYGVEAHSFVHWVAEVKLYWEYNLGTLRREIETLLTQNRAFVVKQVNQIEIQGVFPELIYKCYHPQDLKELLCIRSFLNEQVLDYRLQNLLKLALTDTLRTASVAGTGWPYIAPRKNTGDKPPKQALKVFESTVRKMILDLETGTNASVSSRICNVLGDSRQKQALNNGQIDLALTSPPYLNNYDYADRTRLETYFWGITKSWKDITENYREKLIVAATTQVVRSKYQVETALSQTIASLDMQIYRTIQESVLELSRRRKTKGGKKDYDLMVALYFNDLLAVFQETYRLIRPDGHFCVVIGDSAPYGVHIETENLLGRLGLALGFKNFEYREFRSRGGKWKANPQRHNIKLREGMVVLTK
jgi:DNA modification methylase